MKTQKWYDAIRAANSKPRSAEHRAKLSAARKGKSITFRAPEARLRKIAETKSLAVEQGGCFCGSLKHTATEHSDRFAEARRNSPIWRKRMLEGNALKRGKPINFSDPAGRIEKLKVAFSKPETRRRLSNAKKRDWVNRDEPARRAIGEKIAAAQKGRKFLPEHLANLRRSNSQPRTEEHCRKLSESCKGREAWNKGLTKFTNASVMSNSLKQRGRIPDYNKYRTHYNGPKGHYLMRSKWEVAYVEWLDKQNVDWQYEPRWFKLDGTSYTPDFYLPIEDRYVEIKGRMTEKDTKKLKLFAECYPQIKLMILQRAELTAIGLLDRHCQLVGTVR